MTRQRTPDASVQLEPRHTTLPMSVVTTDPDLSTFDGTDRDGTVGAQSLVRPIAVDSVGVGALGGVAAMHLSGLSDEFAEVPYLGLASVAVIAGSVGAIVLVLRHDRRGWPLGGGLALMAFITFVLSHTTGLPASNDDIGNWSEPFGIWSLIAEGLVIAVAFDAMVCSRQPSRSEISRSEISRFDVTPGTASHGSRHLSQHTTKGTHHDHHQPPA